MTVSDLMGPTVHTAAPSTRLGDAYRLMQTHGIRHLPVVESGRLVGIVTDRDLRLATSALHPHPFDPAAHLAEVMTPDPVTAAPLDPVEEAARTMRARKIGCLPVVDGERLVGIVTGTDLLDALLHLTGQERPGGRLVVRLDDAPGRLAALTARLAEAGINIHSVLSTPEAGGHLQLILRVGTLQTRPLAEALRREGFTIAWPPEKPWSP